jgi:hypothetical protein
MKALEILIGARALIADKRRWSQGVVARAVGGSPVNIHSMYACSWCAVGAVHRVAGDEATGTLVQAKRYLSEACQRLGYELIAVANDYGGHEVVLAAFDSAIARLQERGQ